ncbi:hypothetical protein ACLQ28_00255 [Micromonospora sp. DT201]|uniref:hypothetical protein n=1 Tax=Micromonospora sp. DT201 TaxID=3393442 RepID=UPI003CECEC7C
MPDFDAQLDAEFSKYRETMLPAIAPDGPAAVRHIVRRRRRRAAVAVAVALVVAVTVPVAGQVGLRRDSGPAPATAPPTPSDSPSPVVSSPPAVPDGRIDRAELLAATVDLPAWDDLPDRPNNKVCASRGVRLSGDPVGTDTNLLVELDYGDVDRDGATETVILVRCLFGTRGPAQVVAFDRDAAGRIITLGRVAATADPAPEWLIGAEVRADGVTRVAMADRAPGVGWPLEQSQRQWRGYTWDGQRFRQVEGPRAFGPNPYAADLSVSSSNLALVREPGDSFSGTIEVRVRNASAGEVPEAVLSFGLPWQLRPVGDGWDRCRENMREARAPYQCTLGRLAPHADIRLTLRLQRAQGVPLSSGKATVEIFGTGADGSGLLERDRDDNQATFTHYYR